MGRGSAWGASRRGSSPGLLLGLAGAWEGGRESLPQFSLCRALSAAALFRALSSSRPDSAAELTTHRGVGAPAAGGGGEEEVRRCRVREGEEKGGRERLWGPMASGSEEGHQSSWPLSRPPPPRPRTGGMCRALDVTWEATSIHKLDLDPVCASIPSSTPTPTPGEDRLGGGCPPYLGNLWQSR